MRFALADILKGTLGTAMLIAVPAFAAGGLNGFKLNSCSTGGDKCIEIRAPRMDQSSIGEIWVSNEATVKLKKNGRQQEWTRARVIIDLKQEQVVIERLNRGSVTETVISLNEFGLNTRKMNL